MNNNPKNSKTNGWGSHSTAAATAVKSFPRGERDEGTEVDTLFSTIMGLPAEEYAELKAGAPVNGNAVLGETHPTATYQDFKEIRSRCVAESKLFEDPEFPAVDRSLYYKEKIFDKPITWLRPGEICKPDLPKLFVDGYSRFDVIQGGLGDCWLMAAIANLTLHRKLFFQVVPDDQSFDEDYAGVFHFRFWQYGTWVDVVIDDRLPTSEGKLVFLHSPENKEFWGPLLEKAYAKLHGSYESLISGNPSEAMEKFTGGFTEYYDMAELPPNFFTILLKAYERNSLITCSIDEDPKTFKLETSFNLYQAHSYSVTKVKYVDIETSGRAEKKQLLRLRNPWGSSEWNGPWRDESPKWRSIPKSEKEEMGLTFDNDGEFWMSFEDFVDHFSELVICNLNPASLDPEDCPEGCTKKWQMSAFEGKWVKDVTANADPVNWFSKNPQYTITLKDVDEGDNENKCTIIVDLMHKNTRSQGRKHLPIYFYIYRLPENGHGPKPLDVNFFKNFAKQYVESGIGMRQATKRCKLDPGSYVIVVTTWTIDEGEFLLRVVTEKSHDTTEHAEDIGKSDVDA